MAKIKSMLWKPAFPLRNFGGFLVFLLFVSSTAVLAKTSEISVGGLTSPGEIIVDKWGVAHIYAENDADAYFLQGFNAARDRLWQIDFWRKRGLGELSAVLGKDYVENDYAARLFLYRGDMEAEWAAYGPTAKAAITDFVRGINAYVQRVKNNPEILPEEFKKLNYEPSFWQPSDVLRIRAHGVTVNLHTEVARALTLCKHGEKAEMLRQKLEPAWTPEFPEGVEPCDIPEDVLTVYKNAKHNTAIGPSLVNSDEEASDESNNWVIAAHRSETGRPVLANDPHRRYSIPSLRYLVHVDSPNLTFTGAGEPFQPGVSLGHNGDIAFGFTIHRADQEDLYVYTMNPNNPDLYRYKDEWEVVEKLQETIEVRGGKSVEVTLEFTRHGPIIYRDDENDRAFAVRTLLLQPGLAAYIGSLNFLKSTTAADFMAALDAWGGPGENMIAADTKGNIAWQAAAFFPLRANWDGLFPVPGDGRYEWGEVLNRSSLPSSYNPESGWIATANEMNVPEEFPMAELKTAFEWSEPDRFDRIKEFFSSKEKFTLEDSLALQNDTVSVPARIAVNRILQIEALSDELDEAIGVLGDWDFRLDVDSAAAALFSIWFYEHFPKAVYQALVKSPLPAGLSLSRAKMRDMLEDPEAASGDILSDSKLNAIIERSLIEAVAHIQDKTNKKLRDVEWGLMNKLNLRHPFYSLLQDESLNCANTTNRPTEGGFSTADVAHYKPNGEVFHGASVRLVMDVGEWENSRAVNMPGQSGDPNSRHYCNLTEHWIEGEYFPMLFAREKVEKAVETWIKLVPFTK